MDQAQRPKGNIRVRVSYKHGGNAPKRGKGPHKDFGFGEAPLDEHSLAAADEIEQHVCHERRVKCHGGSLLKCVLWQ
jgi:hypothetical protein